MRRVSFLKFKIITYYFSALATMILLTGCPANTERKAAREIYQNKMNFDFKASFNINYNGIQFVLPKKFGRNHGNYETICTNGSDCRSFSFDDLNLYFGISEIKKGELSNILFINDLLNPLDAVLEDAALKRKLSMFKVGKVSEMESIKYQLSSKMVTITEPFQKTYTWEEDDSSLYYVAAIKKKNRFYVIQFCGKKDKMVYFLDDFKRIIRSMK
jgi:hypothetical protein